MSTKNNLRKIISIVAILFVGCTHNGLDDSLVMFKDYSLIHGRATEIIHEYQDKPTLYGRTMLYQIKNNTENYITVIGKGDSLNMYPFVDKKSRVYKIVRIDAKYGPLPTYLKVSENGTAAWDIMFIDNTISVDSLINCYVSNYQNDSIYTYSAKINQKDTVQILDKIINSTSLNITEKKLAHMGRYLFDGSLKGYLGKN